MREDSEKTLTKISEERLTEGLKLLDREFEHGEANHKLLQAKLIAKVKLLRRYLNLWTL